MAGELLQYSGIVTKTRAMHGRLLEHDTLYGLTEYESVNDFINFLREEGSYGSVYKKYERIAHRAQVEEAIDESLFDDFGKLYRFANKEQRECLEIQLLRYETMILKHCLWRVSQGIVAEHSFAGSFLKEHLPFDIADMQHATTIAEVLNVLRGTQYEGLLRRLSDTPDVTYADYAISLDVEFFKAAWKRKDKIRSKATKEIVEEIIGTEIDWQNIMWIYRQKKFFDSTDAEIYDSIIPIRYRIKKPELKSYIEAENVDIFLERLSKSVYFTEKDPLVSLDEEISYRKVMDKVYARACQRHPMSIAPVYRYLHEKENEIDVLTTIMEGVRYRIPPREIQDSIVIV